MNRSRLLNADLSHAIASMGHGDLMIVCDAGFPIPSRAPLLEKLKRLFPDADHAPAAHETILGEMAAKAKVIVRTGAFDPWGNILLYSGVDVPAWFSKEGVVAPDYYAEKLKR